VLSNKQNNAHNQISSAASAPTFPRPALPLETPLPVSQGGAK
jgi:hypothetical protein